MGVSFAQPLAFWVLLGLPAILLLHFLQSRDRKEQVSTLFLLDVLPEETRRGAVFTRLLAGPQLWLQLLAVICLTLLLAQPLWLRKDSIQSVALVVDVSASMQAFRDDLKAPLQQRLTRLADSAGRTEWHILPSDSSQARIYAGQDLDAALSSLSTLPMTLGPHDPTPALVRARQLTGAQGAVLWVTDHPQSKTAVGVVPLGVGTPTVNSSISGIHFEQVNNQWQWEATLLHWGPDPISTTLSIILENQEPVSQAIQLQPGGITRASGTLPPGSQQGELQLPEDAFPLDNRYPFVVPHLADIPVDIRAEPPFNEWAEKVLNTVPGIRKDPKKALVAWRRTIGPVPPPIAKHEVIILAKGRPAPFKQPVAENHPLTRDLPWNGLIAIPRQRRPFSGEQVLVWMGDVPLISLLPHEKGEQLVLNLDPEQSNADRMPAVILLLNRYLQQVVARQTTHRSLNLETGQVIEEPIPATAVVSTFTPLTGPAVTETLSTVPDLAPKTPGYWNLSDPEADKPRIRTAVAFGALEEADLRTASSTDLPSGWVAGRREQNSEKDLLRPWLLALLGGCLLGSWITGTSSGGRT